MSAKVDLTGQRFGRLIVIKELPRKTALRQTPLWLFEGGGAWSGMKN